MKPKTQLCILATGLSIITPIFAENQWVDSPDFENEELSYSNEMEAEDAFYEKAIADAQPPAEQPAQSKAKKPAPPARCSARQGGTLYEEYGTAMHGRREQNELSPSEWMTTLLFHRILLPLTADDYCSMLDYFTDCTTGLNTEDTAQEVTEFTSNEQGKPPLSCKLGKLPKSNFLLKGTSYATFDDLADHNNSFRAGLNPIFLWRYGTRILYEMEFEVALEDGMTTIGMEYGNLNYIVNDYMIVRGGKFLLPLGFWKEKMHPEWINKLPTPPLPYADEANPVIPPSDLGLDIRGAVPVGTWGGRLAVPMVLTYDFWCANGPREDAGDIVLDGTNYNDNNNNKSIGARLSFRPWPYREFGISGMRAQWNNNTHGGDVSSKRDLYYNAIVADTDLHFTDYFRFCGEFMWTKKQMPKDSDVATSTDVTQRAFWAQVSSTCLALTKVEYIKDLEMVVRYGLINTTGQNRNQRQWSFGLNYYLTSKMLFKAGYDLNWGTNNGDDRFAVQWAYGY